MRLEIGLWPWRINTGDRDNLTFSPTDPIPPIPPGGPCGPFNKRSQFVKRHT